MTIWSRGLLKMALIIFLTPGWALSAEQHDDVLAIVVKSQIYDQPALYLETMRSTADIAKLGRVDLFCSRDGLGWAIIRVNGRLIAINGTGKTWARKGMQAFLRNGSTQMVVPADEARDVNLPDTFSTISAARAPCIDHEPGGIDQTIVRMKEAVARYSSFGSRYR